MISPKPPITKRLKNLFPEAFKKRAHQIFGERAIFPVLLERQEADRIDDRHPSDTYPADILHPNEAAILSKYTFHKRRSEYLTGRVCAKMAVQEFLNHLSTVPRPVPMPEIEIANMAGGRPFLRLHGAKAAPPTIDVSISHSGDYGVALAAGLQCGIDVQEKKETLRKVREKYCSEDECMVLEEIFPDHETLTGLAMLWAAKEAAKKALSDKRAPGFLDLKLKYLQRIPDSSTLVLHLSLATKGQPPGKVTVVTGMFRDYALAVCLVSEENDA